MKKFVAEWAKGVSTEKLLTGKNWLTDISPEIKIQTGDQDSFNGIIAKAVGYHAIFSYTTINGILAPDSQKYFSVFPFSVGIETNRNFDNMNGLFEIGYMPFQKIGDRYFLGLDPILCIFLQGGYKFKLNDPEIETGGAKDESKEKPDNGLFRTKLGGKADFILFRSETDFKFSLSVIPEGWVWYDFINDDWYHQVIGILRLSISGDKHFDFKYENGSGAPNFNEGQQFSANLTINF